MSKLPLILISACKRLAVRLSGAPTYSMIRPKQKKQKQNKTIYSLQMTRLNTQTETVNFIATFADNFSLYVFSFVWSANRLFNFCPNYGNALETEHRLYICEQWSSNEHVVSCRPVNEACRAAGPQPDFTVDQPIGGHRWTKQKMWSFW